MAEMVGQIEAREEASERLAEGPWQPRGEAPPYASEGPRGKRTSFLWDSL